MPKILIIAIWYSTSLEEYLSTVFYALDENYYTCFICKWISFYNQIVANVQL